MNWRMFFRTLVFFVIEVVIALYVHDDIIRPYVGDILVIILIYCAIRTVDGNRIKGLPYYIFIFAVLIEVTQWFNLVELLNLQDHPIASAILGSTFDWKDIVSYAIGLVILLIVEHNSERKEALRRQKRQARRSRRRYHPDEIMSMALVYGKRVAFILAGLLIVLGLSTYVVNLHVIRAYKDKIVTSDEGTPEKVDCIMVLGAGVWKNNMPSPILNDRLLRGVELYNSGLSNRLLMSGDHGTVEYDEVNVMKQFAIAEGVKSNHIFMDHAGFSTYESMVRAKEVFQVESMIIVTQEYHMYRALYIANSLGIDAYGITSDQQEYAGGNWRNFREVMARLKDYIYVKLEKSPKYLGEEIPISGSGAKTDD